METERNLSNRLVARPICGRPDFADGPQPIRFQFIAGLATTESKLVSKEQKQRTSAIIINKTKKQTTRTITKS
jgi:hypothetical protein